MADNFNAKQFIVLAATTTAATGNITQVLGTAADVMPLYNARVYNSGTAIVAVTFGGSGVTATSTTGLIMGPNAPAELVNMGGAAKGVSAIALAGSSAVYVQVG